MDLCVIPARMGSSRFPNKPMVDILGMPMIGHVALRCSLENIFSHVIVATCDKVIIDYCASIGIQAVMTSDKHERASDRVQEAARILEKQRGIQFNTVTMVQGDEPMVTPSMLRTALQGLKDNKTKVVNLRSQIHDIEEFNSPNCVKVVCDHRGNALYFSRCPVPSISKAKVNLPKSYKQVCIIPFERKYLDTYSDLSPTYLEEIESVDMNRILEHGDDVLCVEIQEESFPVDVPEDLVRVSERLKSDPLLKKYLR